MVRWLMAIVGGLMLALPAAAPAAPAKRAAAHDWTATVTRTPAGAYVIGNPAAKVKLIEYLSLTCPHCAHFAAEGFPKLRDGYIKDGRVSLEVRHALRDPFDLSASLLARCAGPRGYLASVEAIYAAQAQWMGKAMTMTQAEGEALNAMPVAKRAAVLAKQSGLDTLMRARGLSDARQAACLADAVDTKRLTDMTEEAWGQRKIPGTPAFLINGTIAANVVEWSDLEPLIVAALRRP